MSRAHSTRFRDAQKNRTLCHPLLPQPDHRLMILCKEEASSATHDATTTVTNASSHSEVHRHSPQHSFVVCADSQLGMTNANKEWDTELAYCRDAVALINTLRPRPSFCCICGDLADMESSFYLKDGYTKLECDEMQDQQNEDFQRVFSKLHPSIAIVCLCGNHDVGNRPTHASIERYKAAFGDDYLAFWVNGTYNIVLNSCLFSDPTAAQLLYEAQLVWLEERLQYAGRHSAANVFVYGHHPWFLYHEEEQDEELDGLSPYPVEWGRTEGGFPDAYFHIPYRYRTRVMKLFREYGVSAVFSGHFHQNLVSKSSWGMEMIITAPLSMVFESTGKPKEYDEPNGRGVRVVAVDVPKEGHGNFRHHFRLLEKDKK